MVISGTTAIFPLMGFPTTTFKAPMIYNPWFEKQGIDALVVPMGVKPEQFREAFNTIKALSNLRGALITMPHKVSVMELCDELSTTAKVAGACNAIRVDSDGQVHGDQFDGSGFVRGLKKNGFDPQGARAMVVGAGGVGCAIAASLAGAGVKTLALYDAQLRSAEQLMARLKRYYPKLKVTVMNNDPYGFDIVVNATPLGMKADDPLPFDIEKVSPKALVGEVVLKAEHTPLLRAALDKGCKVQVGTDMLFEMIPAYLEFFGLGTATAEELRAVAQIKYH